MSQEQYEQLRGRLAEIWDLAGVQFDPECVQAFLRIRPRVEEALRTGSAQTLETCGREAYALLR